MSAWDKKLADYGLTLSELAAIDNEGDQMTDKKEMTFSEYERLAQRTAAERTMEQRLIHAQMGLSSEAGEVSEHLKHHLFHGHPLDRDHLIKELGDLMWYLAEAAVGLGVPMEEIAKRNIEKLKGRYPEGFSTERSMNRGDP